MKCLFLFLFISFISISPLFAQGSSCSNIEPFCAGDSRLIFLNSNRNNSSALMAEPGPDYQCLFSQPYPAWFFLQIEDDGNLDFTILQTRNQDGSGGELDVDFIAWGPFDAEEDYCNPTSLSAANVVDCSYSPAAVESFSIRNARRGEIYVILLTNFSALPGFISLQQTNAGAPNSGSTDCTIVGPNLGEDRAACVGTPEILDATNNQATSYTWLVLNEETNEFEEIPGETNSTLEVSETGTYRVTIFSSLLDDEASDDVTIEFLDIPVASQPNPFFACGFDNDDISFDLTRLNEDLIGDNSNTSNFTVLFYESQQDFDENNPITNIDNYPGEDEQIIFGTITNETTGCESLPVSITLKTQDSPLIDLPEITAACIDMDGNLISPITIGEDAGAGFLYQWTPTNPNTTNGVEDPIYIINEIPDNKIFSLKITNLETGCEQDFTTEIKLFAPPQNVSISISGSDFNDEYTVTASAETTIGDPAVYEFQLDNGEFQLANVFNNVAPGDHTITAREINGCGSATSSPFRLIGYPRFFTPNGDGFNDTWNVINDANVSITKVVIFDRYGKLITEILPNSGGWDGTYRGRSLPADDYWFIMDYNDPNSGEPKQFKGNFSLVRRVQN